MPGPPRSTIAQAVDVVGEFALRESFALDRFRFVAFARGREYLVEARRGNRERAIAVEHDRVAERDRGATHLERSIEFPNVNFRRTARADVARPYR